VGETKPDCNNGVALFGRPQVIMKQQTKIFSGVAARRAGFLFGLGFACLAASAVFAKEAPKLNISDRPVDRSARGMSYADAIKRVTPCVVTIESTRTVDLRNFQHPSIDDPFLRRFFGRGYDSSNEPSRKMRQQSLGSGIVVTEDGYILTNNHVVEDADDDGIKVRMPDGKTSYDAKVVGRDPLTDIAVVKIDTDQKLPAITLANSDELEVGDVVLAIGNPFGIGQSVSSGIVSALGRGFGILGRDGYEDFIQTDASINQGNSGGALVDAEGRLIGINQSIASPSGVNAGVGFAVPINLARTVMERLISDGHFVRGYLGVGLQTLTPEMASAFKLNTASGALVGGVLPATPAAKAGIEAGDVIVGYNGKTVDDSSHLRIMVAQTPPDTTVSFKLIRDGKPRTVKVTLAELPNEAYASGGRGNQRYGEWSKYESQGLKGVQLGDLDRETRQRSGIPNRIRGAVVEDVAAESAAANAGLQAGDVVVEVNRQPVTDAEEARAALRDGDGRETLLRVYSQNGDFSGTHYLIVKGNKK